MIWSLGPGVIFWVYDPWRVLGPGALACFWAPGPPSCKKPSSQKKPNNEVYSIVRISFALLVTKRVHSDFFV